MCKIVIQSQPDKFLPIIITAKSKLLLLSAKNFSLLIIQIETGITYSKLQRTRLRFGVRIGIRVRVGCGRGRVLAVVGNDIDLDGVAGVGVRHILLEVAILVCFRAGGVKMA